MRRIFLISFLFLFFSLSYVQAALVPCGPGTGKLNCEFCDIFVLSNNILKWIFEWVVTTTAVLMFIVGGVMFLFSGAKADLFNKAKGIITAAVIGLLIIFGAWVIVSTVFDKIGVVEFGQGWKWYSPECKTNDVTPGTTQMPVAPTPTLTTPTPPTPTPTPPPAGEEPIPPLPPAPPAFPGS